MIKNFLKRCVSYLRLRICSMLIRGNTILLITHDLSLSGAPVVLMNLAEILEANGYDVIIISPLKGELEKVLKQKKLRYYVIYKMTKFNNYGKILNKAQYVIVNTIVNYKTIDIVNNMNEKCKKVLWWIHEGDTYLSMYQGKINQKINENIKILVVSEYVKTKLEEYGMFKGLKKELLPYYIDADKDETHYNENEQYTIAVIGSICPRKNQIELIESLKLIQNSRKSLLLYIVGNSIDDDYYRSMVEKIKSISIEVKLIKSVSKENMKEFYKKIDLLVCPSTDDPLPVVVSEAMEYSTLVLCSDHTGHYDFIDDGYNGFTYKVGNIKELSEKIEFIINLKIDEVRRIVKNEKMLVNKILSEDNFKNKVLTILED